MSAQVKEIRQKFTSRIWILRHLGHRVFSKDDLLKVYKAVILPIHDYCSCVNNSSLTMSQASVLERLQSQALKAIYGYEFSYRALLEMTSLPTLQQRRDTRALKFASKCLANERFSSWFPRNNDARFTRGQLPFKEFRARTNRLHNSPIFDLRRRLNGRG